MCCRIWLLIFIYLFILKEKIGRKELKMLEKQLESPHSSFGMAPSCGGGVTFSSKWFCQPMKCQPGEKQMAGVN